MNLIQPISWTFGSELPYEHRDHSPSHSSWKRNGGIYYGGLNTPDGHLEKAVKLSEGPNISNQMQQAQAHAQIAVAMYFRDILKRVDEEIAQNQEWERTAPGRR